MYKACQSGSERFQYVALFVKAGHYVLCKTLFSHIIFAKVGG